MNAGTIEDTWARTGGGFAERAGAWRARGTTAETNDNMIFLSDPTDQTTDHYKQETFATTRPDVCMTPI